MTEEKREKVINGLEHELQNRGKCGHYCRDGIETVSCEYDKDGLCIQHWGNDALALLKAQKPSVAYWIPCNGKSHIWYCSECGEKINYNDARRTYKTEKKPVEAVNRYCRGCGATMVQRPTDEQRKAVKWE